MKKSVLVSVLFLSVSIISYSQNKFVEGYVITTSRDTLGGFVFDQQLDKETRRVQFKKSLTDSKITTYKPLDIVGFFVKPYGEFYLGQALDIDIKPISQGLLESNPAAKFKKDTVFLKQLARGKANLYYFKDNEKKHFFLQKDKGAIKELLFIIYQTGDVSSTKAEIYKNQLADAFGDCAKTNVKNVDYNQASLTKAFLNYNTCVGSINEYKTSVEKAKTQLYLLAGAMAPTLKYQGGDNYNGQTAKAATFTSAATPLLGIGIKFGSKRPSNPLSLGLELLYRQDSHKSYSNDSKGETTVNLEYKSVRLNGALSYSFINSKLKPYVKVGIASGFSFNETNYMRVIKISAASGNVPTQVYKGEATDLSALDMGFIGGVGIPISKRFIAEARYEFEVKGGADAKLNISGASFVLGYRLY